MSSERLKRYLAENPRMLGVLFMITVLLAQSGSVVADGGTSISGP